MECNYIDFQCASFYDGLYELTSVVSSETQIFSHQDLADAILYYDHGHWSLNHPNKYRWYTPVENIFTSAAEVYWYETDEVLPKLATYMDCVSKLNFLFLFFFHCKEDEKNRHHDH